MNIIELAEKFRAELIAQDAAAIGEMTRRWLAIERAIIADVEALADEIADLTADGETVPQWRLFQLRRYQSLVGQIATEIGRYNQWAQGVIISASAEAQGLGDGHAQSLFAEVVGRDSALTNAWDALPIGAVENIAAIASAGQPLESLLSRAYPTAVTQLTNLLLANTAAGINPRQTARTAVRQGLAGGLNHILLVARDQQIRNYREMVRTRYQQNPYITGYMRLAAKNSRTCMACLALDGTIWQTSEVMPLHPQDRCSMLPLVRNYPAPSFQRGEDWFAELPHATQRKMMGRGRYKAWQEGRFGFGQLATTGQHPLWGPSLRETPLRALLRGDGGLASTR